MVLQQKMFIFSTSTVVGFRWKNNAHTYFRKRFAQLTYLFSSSRIVNIMQRFDSLTTILQLGVLTIELLTPNVFQFGLQQALELLLYTLVVVFIIVFVSIVVKCVLTRYRSSFLLYPAIQSAPVSRNVLLFYLMSDEYSLLPTMYTLPPIFVYTK